ncbi:hypothetical protein ACPOL_2260 [Acidisarcina polymorpha]|uniref:Uncharacterized protein n=1 Tax=Acidisarcina polymorpha TaxID=2211140 RepID=A0A2Z5FYI6_9BACT|nr:hypothetical protein [Acidisarcina polymorpha]AXC11584.1 hypothetical protein ACPOL_2260 [Acidisarcina polymorpha]
MSGSVTGVRQLIPEFIAPDLTAIASALDSVQWQLAAWDGARRRL